MSQRQAIQRRDTRGFGLIEVMVAMLIGLITVVVMMQVITAAERQRRTLSSGSDAGTAGSIAMQGLQRDLMNAGFGLALDANLFTFCNDPGPDAIGGTADDIGGTLTYNNSRSTAALTLPANVFVPVFINPPGMAAADPNTDIIQITFGGSATLAGKPIFVTASALTAGQLNVVPDPVTGLTTLTSGLFNGDLAVIRQTVPGRCLVTQLNTITAGNIIDRVTSVWNEGNTNATLNRGEAYTVGAPGALYGLGQPERFVIRAYAVRNGRLTACSPLYQNCTLAAEWQPMAENVVSLRAEYGVDGDNDNQVAAGEWTRNAPAVWENLKAIRVAMVTRSTQLNQDVVWTDCTPNWAGDINAGAACPAGAPPAGQIVLNTAPDGVNWDHYRYKLVQTTVPLRNLFWSDN
jgi:type IV pilus assembly protein PilW